ncbi:MAG: DUF4199 domain-containing protein [Flavobacteriales bacterium]
MESFNKPIDSPNQPSGNPNVPIFSSALFYGVILAAISIGAGVVAHITDWDTQGTSFKLLTWAIFIGGITWTLWHYKKQKNNGYLRYGQGVGLSVVTGLVAGILGAIYIVIYMKFINTGMVDEIMEQSYEQMADQGMSDTQIDQAMEMTSMFMTPGFFAIISVLSWVIISLIIGLIASAFMKRD